MHHVTWSGQPWSSVIRPQRGCAPASPKGGAGSRRMEIALRSVSAGASCSAPHGARMPRLSTRGMFLHLPLLLFRLRGLSVEEARVHSGAGQLRGDALCHKRPPSHSGGSFQLGVQIQTQVTGRPGKAQRAVPSLGAATLHTWPPSCRSSCCAQSGPWGPGGQGCRERGSCPVPACVATHNHVHTQWIPPSPEPRTGLPKLTWSRSGQVSGSRPPALTWTTAAASSRPPMSTRAPTPGPETQPENQISPLPCVPGYQEQDSESLLPQGLPGSPSPTPCCVGMKTGGGPWDDGS